MESGYNILWTDHALKELSDTYDYIETNFTEHEISKLSFEINRILNLISKNPKLFPLSKTNDVRRVEIKKFNTMYYRELENTIEILSFFSNRQNPKKGFHK